MRNDTIQEIIDIFNRDYPTASDETYEFFHDVLNVLHNAKSEWISVKDRLPPVHFNVLVWCGEDKYNKYNCDEYHIARIDKYGCWYNADKFGGCNPLFWMLIPQKPESEDDA